MRVSAVLRSTIAVRPCACALCAASSSLLVIVIAPLDAQRCDSFVESSDGVAHLLARADGDAHAAIAAGIAGAVANQHAGGAHAADELRMLRADVDENEVGAARPAADLSGVECGLELGSRCEDFAHVPIEIRCVFKRGWQARERERVDAVGREHAAHPAHQICRAREHAETQTGEPIGF